jgi:acetylornithine/succinyldiaminopimelate/putrescine aminotransferase
MWPVDEVDDGEEPPVSDFIATEARIGAHHYEPLGVILSRGEGVWAWDAHWRRYLGCRTDKLTYSLALTTSTDAPAV